MSAHITTLSTEQRKDLRFDVAMPVDVASDGHRLAFGMLENLSRGGAAISVFPLLDIGRAYSFGLRGYGSWAGTVVRRFGVKSHGIRFNIGESEKRKLDDLIRKLSPDMASYDDKETARAVLRDLTIRAF
jgi:PilZ domain-containing protein